MAVVLQRLTITIPKLTASACVATGWSRATVTAYATTYFLSLSRFNISIVGCEVVEHEDEESLVRAARRSSRCQGGQFRCKEGCGCGQRQEGVCLELLGTDALLKRPSLYFCCLSPSLPQRNKSRLVFYVSLFFDTLPALLGGQDCKGAA